jgi:DNA-binding GntR family transcriptional regulator
MTRMPIREDVVGPVMHPSLPDTIHDRLRRAIINGEIAAGTRLLEASLAETFGVSRASIRTAVDRLAQEGLVEVRPRRGAVVIRMSRSDAMDICEARALLEGEAARFAARSLTEPELNEMKALAHAMAAALRSHDVAQLVELDQAFHARIAQQVPNRRIYGLWASLDGQLGALLASTLEIRRLTPDKVAERHLAVLEALATRNPDQAVRAVRSHYIDIWPSEEPSHAE